MTYVDEPNVISEKKNWKKYALAFGVLLLFLGLLFSPLVEGWYREYRAHNTPLGPNDGHLYTIRFEGRRFSLELARPSQIQQLCVFLNPLEEDASWNPAEYRVSYQVRGVMESPEFLEWNEDGIYLADSDALERHDPGRGNVLLQRFLDGPRSLERPDVLDILPPSLPRIEAFYGPSYLWFPPGADLPLSLEIRRGDEVVWSGRRWTYSLTAHQH